MHSLIRIGNAQAFWGDGADAPARLLAQQPNLDYLTLDYLAEVSLSILAIQKDRDPSAGYARDFIEVIRSLIPLWEKGSKVRVVANAGGLNPEGCARACLEVLKNSGCGHLKIGMVTGDALAHVLFENRLHRRVERQLEAASLLGRQGPATERGVDLVLAVAQHGRPPGRAAQFGVEGVLEPFDADAIGIGVRPQVPLH